MAAPTPFEDVRFIGNIPGCFVLSSRQKAGDNVAKVFSCRARAISPRMAVLQAAVRGAVGERLALKLDTLGLIPASVNRHTVDGFVVSLLLAPKEAATIARRIGWLKRHHLKAVPDQRQSKRWLPREPNSSLILPDRREVDCFIIDVSASGVAVSADAIPELGQPVVVGSVIGRVVRQLEAGFAVHFLAAQDPERVESLVSPAKAHKRQLLEEALAAAEAARDAERRAGEAAAGA